jgi:hypothetical protein
MTKPDRTSPDLAADFDLMARMEEAGAPPAPGDGHRLAVRPSRRGFLGRFAGASAAVIGGIAGLSLTKGEAEATPCHVYGCCCLAHPPGGCPGSGTTYSCPSGWYRKYWTCVVNGIGYYCGECQSRNQDCTNKTGNTYLCSEYQRFG